MKEQVLVAPGVDEPEAPVRESLDDAFGHLSNSSKKVPYIVARKHRFRADPLRASHYIGWIGYTQLAAGDQATARAGKRIWSPGGVKVQHCAARGLHGPPQALREGEIGMENGRPRQAPNEDDDRPERSLRIELQPPV